MVGLLVTDTTGDLLGVFESVWNQNEAGSFVGSVVVSVGASVATVFWFNSTFVGSSVVGDAVTGCLLGSDVNLEGLLVDGLKLG